MHVKLLNWLNYESSITFSYDALANRENNKNSRSSTSSTEHYKPENWHYKNVMHLNKKHDVSCLSRMMACHCWHVIVLIFY